MMWGQQKTSADLFYNIKTVVKTIEKLDAISFEDEEGIHILPLKNISSIRKQIGEYNYRKSEYYEQYPHPRYVIKMIGGEYFYITKQLYEKLEKNLYNVTLTDKRSDGKY